MNNMEVVDFSLFLKNIKKYEVFRMKLNILEVKHKQMKIKMMILIINKQTKYMKLI
jgi:hypothetical protein